MTLRVLFRADSGTGIGHGHATRVQTLARAVLNAGGDARIVARRLPGVRPPSADLPPPIWLPLNTPVSLDLAALREDAELTLTAAIEADFNPGVIVVDHYDLGPAWETAIRDTGLFLVALDDMPNRLHNANLVVELLPGSSKPDRLRGIEFFPVDKAYEMPSKDLPAAGWVVLVSFGGGDPTGHTLIACDALELIRNKKPNLINGSHIVIGAANVSAYEVEKRAKLQPWISLHRQIPSLATLMADCHVVLTSAGNSMVESLAARRVTVAVVTAENQVVLAEALHCAGAIKLFSSHAEATALSLADALLDVELKKATVPEIAGAPESRLIDTSGADRLVSEIIMRAKRY